MSLDEKVASLLMLHSPGSDVGQLRAFVESYRPGGLILMGDNVPANPGELAAIIPQLDLNPDLPMLVAIDQEGGTVRRIRSDVAAAAPQLQQLPVAATSEAFASRASLLETLAINVNFGIVADQTSDRSSFIFPRALGTSPGDSADRVAAAVAGESGHVLSTLKHFPGHGAMADDSHTSIPTSDVSRDTWRTTHAVPFERGIDAGAELVMFGHLRYSAVDAAPASLSAAWHTILREELGFTGITVTDDMLMLNDSGEAALADPVQNAVSALAAGTTMLLYVLPSDPASVGADPRGIVAGVVAAVADGRLSESSINEAALKLLVARRQLATGTL
ncbi:glycoside hydrolase family 3 N-terminal domain-containing protein [Glaciihabitans tibetensis]|nr:glycoside hydrolase family 3 N-terminal domain-containing protein [Glaciihabitans tibetensis]